MTIFQYLVVAYFAIGFAGSLIFTFRAFVDWYDSVERIALSMGFVLVLTLMGTMIWLPCLLIYAMGGFVKALFYLMQWIKWRGRPDVLKVLKY